MDYINRFETIKNQWQAFKTNPENKRVRIRDAAAKLLVSEVELLSTSIGESVHFINFKDFNTFLNDILSLDKIMLLTRSDYVVHEITVETNNITLDSNNLIFDKTTSQPLLRLNPDDFHYCLSELKEHQGKNLYSFQFFNKCGNSVIKIYLKGKSENVFEKIISKYKTDYDYSIQKNQPHNIKQTYDSNNLSIQYEFGSPPIKESIMFKEFDGSILRTTMEALAKNSISTQFYGIGPNTIQYYNGIIKNVLDYGPWINVIDKKFNIHILENKIISSRLNSFNIKNKNYHSISFFDKNDNHVMGISSLKENFDKFNHLLTDIGLL